MSATDEVRGDVGRFFVEALLGGIGTVTWQALYIPSTKSSASSLLAKGQHQQGNTSNGAYCGLYNFPKATVAGERFQ